MEKKSEAPLHAYPLLDDSTFNTAYATATAFFAILGEWMILLITCSIALFFIPLTPSFALHSTTSSVLNLTSENHFTANLAVEYLADDSNSMGTTIHYDSLHFSLFHHKQRLSTFSLPPRSFEPTKTTVTEAKFHNISLKIDEWKNVNSNYDGHGTSCGFVYLDLRFSANARYTQPMWPDVRDKLQGHCGELKVEMCSSGTTTVVNSILASCDVYSDLVGKFRVFLFMVLIFLLVIAVAVPLLVDYFFCSSTFS